MIKFSEDLLEGGAEAALPRSFVWAGHVVSCTLPTLFPTLLFRRPRVAAPFPSFVSRMNPSDPCHVFSTRALGLTSVSSVSNFF